MIQTILAFVLLAAPDHESWLGVSLVREGACLRVVGMALQGPYSKAGGGLNQCIVRISGRKITEPADLSALVAAQPNGEIIEIELAKAKALRARLEPKPTDAGEQICLGTTERQVLISIIPEVVKPRIAVYAAPVTLADVVRREHLNSPVVVVLRTCRDQVGEMIEHPSADLRLNFGSTVFVTSATEADSSSSPSKRSESRADDAL